MAQLEKKYKGSTLVETLIALIIVTICLSTGWFLLGNYQNIKMQNEYLRVDSIVDSVYQDVIFSNKFTDQEFDTGKFHGSVSFQALERNNNLSILSIEIYLREKEKLIMKRNYVVE